MRNQIHYPYRRNGHLCWGIWAAAHSCSSGWPRKQVLERGFVAGVLEDFGAVFEFDDAIDAELEGIERMKLYGALRGVGEVGGEGLA